MHPLEAVHLQGLSRSAVEELTERWPEIPSDIVPQALQIDRRQPALPRRAAASAEGTAGTSRAVRVTPRSAQPEPHRGDPRLVARRVSRLPEDVIYLLQAAAVAGNQSDAGIVAEAAGLRQPNGWTP